MTVKEVYDSIIYLLNYMEEMALGVRVGIYNYKIILGARRKDIMKIYFVFEDFIEIGMRKEKIKMYSTSKKVLDRLAIEENKYGIDESSPKMRAKLYEHFEWLVKERLVKDGNRRNVIYTDCPFFTSYNIKNTTPAHRRVLCIWRRMMRHERDQRLS